MYVTDVKAAGTGVKGIQIPDNLNVVATYPIATVTGTGNALAAQAWVDFVVSPEGQKILKKRGFTAATT